MQGLVIINGYPSGEKFIRQGERIAKELCALGLPTKLVKNGEIWSEINGEGCSFNLSESYDFAVYLDKDKYLGRALEKCGLRLFNRAAAVEACDDKLTTYFALQSAGVRLADSIPAPLCYTKGAKPNEFFLRGVVEKLGLPLVAKKSFGSFGVGVQLVHGYAELYELEENWLSVPHFYQRYIAEAGGRDIRAIVIGGRVVAAMERVAKKGEFRSNIELGGEGREILLTKEQIEAAEEAARALRLDYCGVDLLDAKGGTTICEVNSNAFFEGIEGVTGKNIAQAYAKHIFAEIVEKSKISAKYND